MRPRRPAALLILLSAAAASAQTLADFDGAAPLDGWDFTEGPEFPGAAGSIGIGQGRTGSGLLISYETCAAPPVCGNYVAALFSPAAPVAVPPRGGLRLWAKADPMSLMVLRMVDSRDQTFQTAAALGTVALETGAVQKWVRVEAPLALFTDHWGGDGSGNFSGAFTLLFVIVEPRYAGSTDGGAFGRGEVAIDDVAVVADMSGPVNLPAGGLVAASRPPPLQSILGVAANPRTPASLLNMAKAAGFSFVRTDLYWPDVERAKGVFDFSTYDAWAAKLARAGLSPLWILDYGNDLYGGYPETAAQRAAFVRYAAAAAKRYGTRARYEVWNEPGGPFFLSPASFAQLAADAAAAVVRAAPGAVVCTGGITGIASHEGLGYAGDVAYRGAANSSAAFGVHPYRGDAPESAAADAMFLRSLRPYGRPLPPLWNTEWGYPSFGYFSAEEYGDGRSPAARRRQAVLASRTLLTSWLLGFRMAVWYDLLDDTGCAGGDATDAECNFGLLEASGRPKPAYTAVKTLFLAARPAVPAGMLAGLPPGLHALRLDGPGRVRTLVVWAEAAWRSFDVVLPKKVSNVTDFLGVRVAPVGTARWRVREADGPVFVRYTA
ncbi:glycoside hydrolase superfamily [Hyaloraphidium curvatum]|nr:glycoside hydrolase superfamily [Hyaloraphidium curvatum]